MTTPYQKGVRVERLLKQELESQGWTVMRSAGSHGPADLVAWQEPFVWFIQVKRCRSRPELRQAAKDAMRKFDESGAWRSVAVSFMVKLRYQGGWVDLWLTPTCWRTYPEALDLLGQTEWPITEREE